MSARIRAPVSSRLKADAPILPSLPLSPSAKKSETLPEDGDVVHEQALRWMGFVALYDLVNTARLTNGFKENQKILLENQAGLWLAAALMHIPAQKNGSHPKGICLQNYVSFPLMALVSFLASKKC